MEKWDEIWPKKNWVNAFKISNKSMRDETRIIVKRALSVYKQRINEWTSERTNEQMNKKKTKKNCVWSGSESGCPGPQVVIRFYDVHDAFRMSLVSRRTRPSRYNRNTDTPPIPIPRCCRRLAYYILSNWGNPETEPSEKFSPKSFFFFF